LWPSVRVLCVDSCLNFSLCPECVGAVCDSQRNIRFYLSPIDSEWNLLSQMFSFSIPFKALWWESKRTDWAEKQRPAAVRDWPQKLTYRVVNARDPLAIVDTARNPASFALFLAEFLADSFAVYGTTNIPWSWLYAIAYWILLHVWQVSAGHRGIRFLSQ
jgi:hypothetical protein